MNETTVRLILDGRVGTLLFERADGVQGVGSGTKASLNAHLLELATSDAVDVVVLRSGPGAKTFIMGADVEQLDGLSALEATRFAGEFQDMCDRLENLPQLTLAAMSGPTFGGGCEIALACDLRFASTRMRMALPEVTLGLMPGGGGTARLARLAGASVALELILSGSPLDAARGVQVGVVNRAFAPEELDEGVDAFVQVLIAQSSPALRLTKGVIRRTLDGSLASANELERLAFGVLASTPEAHSGVSAFLARRNGISPNGGKARA
ncbi:MAG: crt2 [Frankiales bacterium]|nr:crt2 [Frankiales bacterium]